MCGVQRNASVLCKNDEMLEKLASGSETHVEKYIYIELTRKQPSTALRSSMVRTVACNGFGHP
jgi:hypothetical protein